MSDAATLDLATGVEAGREALAKIEHVLAKRPHKDDYELSDATQALCRYRDALIGAGGDRLRLQVLNSVLLVVIGVHFPIGETPWDELEKARGWLQGLLPN